MLQAGRPDEAVKSFRDALSLVSRGSGDKGWRAGLYSAIGGAEEARGKPDVAYDAYRKAVDLDPGQERARQRLAEMEKAAGIPPRK
jgi:Tfp pilus assembly protein PilF